MFSRSVVILQNVMAKPDVYSSVEALKIDIFYIINKRENPYSLEGWEGSWCCRCSAHRWLVVRSLGALQPAVLLLPLPVGWHCRWAARPMPAVVCPALHGGGWHFLQVWRNSVESMPGGVCVLLCCVEEMKFVVLLNALSALQISRILLSSGCYKSSRKAYLANFWNIERLIGHKGNLL